MITASQADVVTLTIGGNDAGFADVVLSCIAINNCGDYYPEMEQNIRDLEDELTATYEDIIRVLEENGSSAPLYVIGYPYLVPDPADPRNDDLSCLHLTDEEMLWLREMSRVLNDTVRAAVAGVLVGNPVRFVDVANALQGHEVCQDDAWIHGPTLPPNHHFTYHPMADGHRQLARCLALELEGSAWPDACRPLM